MATDTLRNARGALEEGLISEDDFESVKVAFLKAQQYKAGLDAGFIEPADYAEVKARFLDDIAGLSVTGTSAAPASAAAQPSQPARPAASAASAMAPPATQGRTPPPSPPPGRAASPSLPPSAAQAPASDGTELLPTNIPRLGGSLRKNNGPSVSMSGITVSEDAVNLFYYMKAKSTYRWAMWKINDAGTEIVITAVGPKDATYEHFVSALPPNDPRFAVYDYQVTNSEGRVFNKLVFFSWSPDTAKIKAKMMYASSKDFFKSYLEGLSIELQVSDLDDISEEDIHTHVLSVLTRK